MRPLPFFALAASLVGVAARAESPSLQVVAAESVYGEVAQELAGPDARVTSILSNPAQDPHLFEATPSVARALAGAAITLANGAGYDPWMDRLLAASRNPARVALTVAEIVHATVRGNPHLWYAPATMPAVADALTAALCRLDPPHAPAYRERRTAFLASLAPLQARIAAIRAERAGVTITATEPVFGLMAQALGLKMRNERFQLAVMNDTEPRASDVAAFEADLREHRVSALLFNAQVVDASTTRLVSLAREFGIPVVGVTETLPPRLTYVAWMEAQLGIVATALKKPGSGGGLSPRLKSSSPAQ